MKILACLAAILVLSEAGFPHPSLLRALGREDSGITLLDFPTYSETCTSNTLRECISCSEAKLCLPNGQPIAKINCSSYSPSTPFCNPEDGLCTASAPLSCVQSPFQCPTQDGVYPDPQDCAQFHYCVKGVVTTVLCPKNNVYDHSLRTCKLRRWIVDCVKFNCANKDGQDVVYPKDDRIWATCAGGNAYIMGRCEEYENYNVAQKKCSRVCRTVENQPIKGVCDSYIRCAEVGSGKLEAVTFPCPPGQGFDEDSKQCSTKAACLNETDDSDNEPKNETGSVASRIINNSGSNNANNNVENGNDSVDGNLVNGNNNGNNYNSGNTGSGNQGRALFSSRINNSGNDNAGNDVANGNDNTNGNLVNGNDNSGNTNAGNVGSGNRGGPSSRINNSGNDNAGNNVENGDDNTNGNLVNGNDNSGNTNAGNVGSGNRGGLSSRIINSSGNSNSNQTIVNGNDNTNGDIINGNNNNNNQNSNNTGSGNLHGRNEDPEVTD